MHKQLVLLHNAVAAYFSGKISFIARFSLEVKHFSIHIF